MDFYCARLIFFISFVFLDLDSGNYQYSWVIDQASRPSSSFKLTCVWLLARTYAHLWSTDIYQPKSSTWHISECMKMKIGGRVLRAYTQACHPSHINGILWIYFLVQYLKLQIIHVLPSLRGTGNIIPNSKMNEDAYKSTKCIMFNDWSRWALRGWHLWASSAFLMPLWRNLQRMR